MASLYLKLDYTRAEFYEDSKTEQPGFKLYEHPKGHTLSRPYRKYYTGKDNDFIEGKLVDVSIKEGRRLDDGTVIPKKFSFSLLATDNTTYRNVEMSMGDRYFASFVQKLGNLSKGQHLIISPYNFVPEGKEYPIMGLSIKDEHGTKIDYFLSKDAIPRWEKKKVQGETRWDTTEYDNFLYDHLVAQIEEKFSSSTSEAPAEQNATQEASAAPQHDERPLPEDDLPF
jgi:hypothetical protein